MQSFYGGKVVPDLMDKGGEMSCNNSYCSGVSCLDCINFPSELVDEIFQSYKREKNRNEFISRYVEQLPNDTDDERC